MAEQAAIAAGRVAVGWGGKVVEGGPIGTVVGGVADPTPTVDQATEIRHRQEAIAAQKGKAKPVNTPPAALPTPPPVSPQPTETPKRK